MNRSLTALALVVLLAASSFPAAAVDTADVAAELLGGTMLVIHADGVHVRH